MTLSKPVRVTGIVLFVLICAYFLLRSPILRAVAARAATAVEENYGFKVSTDGLRMTGLAGISIDRLEICPLSGDTLIVVDSLYLRPSVPHAVFGKLKMTEVIWTAMHVHLIARDSVANFKPRKASAGDTTSGSQSMHYGRMLRDLSRRAFNLAPQRSSLQHITLQLETDSVNETLTVPFFVSDGDSVHGILENGAGKRWTMDGTYAQDEETFRLRIFPEGAHTSSVPLVRELFNGYLSFDTLVLQLDRSGWQSDHQEMGGQLHATGVRARHVRMSDDTVKLRRADFQFQARVGEESVELDSATTAQLNDLRFRLYARVKKGREATYVFNLQTGAQPASAFFSSLPEGMFTELQGVDAKGDLDFSMRFRLEAEHPDDLVFDVRMKKRNFRLTQYGHNSLLKMNSEFAHTVYEYGRPVRTFVVGPSSSGFVPLDQVSPFLRSAVLTSEDGNFFVHNGFNEDAFRNSIAANYKAGRFVRGGSTISMQLVKNVYLTRKKTVARKAEEALIVWLIENNRLVSKDRMFEVYLNIVEWGPLVYGAKEASAFYFNKVPSELTLGESIFLSSLLPHPKWFKYSFDTTGALKPYFADYYRVVSNFMLKKGLITEEEHAKLVPRVELLGPARTMVLPKDTIPLVEDEDD